QRQASLRNSRVIAQRDLASHAEPLLLSFYADVQIILGESESVAVQSASPQRTEHHKRDASKLHLHPDFFRRCFTISNSNKPAATETFSDGTCPSIGIETRKSHFLLTRSCSPLPSAPSTTAQSIL